MLETMFCKESRDETAHLPSPSYLRCESSLRQACPRWMCCLSISYLGPILVAMVVLLVVLPVWITVFKSPLSSSQNITAQSYFPKTISSLKYDDIPGHHQTKVNKV